MKALKLSNDFPILSSSIYNKSEDIIIAGLEALDSVRNYSSRENSRGDYTGAE